ncbi:MAG: RNA polymerase sigma factor [Planctomycetota bacterium]|nr:RNA polymerase sigma factor [Planctomycetota bacterium]
MNETSVSLLGRACVDSKSESWDRLASIYTPILRAWMTKYELQDSDADDLVQDVLLTVSRELPAFEHSGRTGAFRSWLRTILVYRVKSFWKSRNRLPNAKGGNSVLEELLELEDETSNTSRLWDAQHDEHVLARLLEQIRPRFEETTWEAFCRQMYRRGKGSDVGEALGISLKTVQLAKSRVLNALRVEAAGLIDDV